MRRGAGKTRLAQEFGARAARRGDRVLFGNAVELQGSDPYRPLADVLFELLDLQPDSSPAERRQHLTACLQRNRLEAAVFAPPLYELLLLECPAGSTDAASVDVRRHMLFESLSRVLSAAARHQPVCVVLDDLQWAHDSVFHTIDFLSSALTHVPILLLLSYRTEEVASGRHGMAHPLRMRERAWEPAPGVERIELPRLSLGAVEQLCQAVGLGRDRASPVVDQTGGLALFVTELIRTWDPVAAPDLPLLTARARQIIHARLDRLGPEDRAVLRCAALLGETFSGKLVARLLGEAEASVYHQLERTREAHHLVVSLGHGRYRLTHARIRTCLRDEIPDHLRKSLYRAAGEALEAESAEDPRLLLEQAYFFREAGDLQRAARDAARAGLLLLQQQEFSEAWGHARDAYRLLERSGEAEAALRAGVLRAVAQVAHETGNATGEPDQEAVAAHCREALEQVSDPLERADLWCWLADIKGHSTGAGRECLDAADRELGGRTDVVQTASVLVRRIVDDARGNMALIERANRIFAATDTADPAYFSNLCVQMRCLSMLRGLDALRNCMTAATRWVEKHGDTSHMLRLQDAQAAVRACARRWRATAWSATPLHRPSSTPGKLSAADCFLPPPGAPTRTPSASTRPTCCRLHACRQVVTQFPTMVGPLIWPEVVPEQDVRWISLLSSRRACNLGLHLCPPSLRLLLPSRAGNWLRRSGLRWLSGIPSRRVRLARFFLAERNGLLTGLCLHCHPGKRRHCSPASARTFEVRRLGTVPRPKVAQGTLRILGDVNNDDGVNTSDALIVATYGIDHSITPPNGGDGP